MRWLLKSIMINHKSNGDFKRLLLIIILLLLFFFFFFFVHIPLKEINRFSAACASRYVKPIKYSLCAAYYLNKDIVNRMQSYQNQGEVSPKLRVTFLHDIDGD
jgi:hypothetical protein